MEANVLTARSIERARRERLRVNRTKRSGVYWCWSHTDPAKKYVLIRTRSHIVCSCESYHYRQECKHKQALLQRLARTGEKEYFIG